MHVLVVAGRGWLVWLHIPCEVESEKKKEGICMVVVRVDNDNLTDN